MLLNVLGISHGRKCVLCNHHHKQLKDVECWYYKLLLDLSVFRFLLLGSDFLLSLRLLLWDLS